MFEFARSAGGHITGRTVFRKPRYAEEPSVRRDVSQKVWPDLPITYCSQAAYFQVFPYASALRGSGSDQAVDLMRRHLIHPRDEEGQLLVDHLRRIGCTVSWVFSIPSEPPLGVDALFVALEAQQADLVDLDLADRSCVRFVLVFPESGQAVLVKSFGRR